MKYPHPESHAMGILSDRASAGNLKASSSRFPGHISGSGLECVGLSLPVPVSQAAIPGRVRGWLLHYCSSHGKDSDSEA
eukprot:1827413-Rhodomonas_salina.1